METNQNKPNEDINPITDENKHNPYTNQKNNVRKYENEDLESVKEHEYHDAKQNSANRDINEVMNGSMAPNMDEIKQLGKDMEGMKTNEDLTEEGLLPDPIQNEREEEASR
ncbi:MULTISPECIES: hypothetical protein [Paenibacillus]|uniref:hypothetical protein n=1 Tax=Paenibacillus TaxID=44249 RepID=UPI00020D66D2|nr:MULTISPECIES: hypothetical protein [Paenibacillus]EGL16605.1 hypothetical protein HMPREF9413_5861 [Paenibacillus sp. HGF7]EPD82361.1 hypothetical protein HMPREF1207_04188 [Paenibacillus sp. HGH0039]MBV6714297.1 hypothetical protein [Paenibacillus chitinolyticus]